MPLSEEQRAWLSGILSQPSPAAHGGAGGVMIASPEVQDGIGRAIHGGIQIAGRAAAKGADLAGRAVDKGTDIAGRAADKGADLAGRAVDKGAEIAGRVADK